MREGFVGVHIGAGQHAESRTDLYLSICAQACKVAVEELRKGSDALEAACKATMVLEDAGETNASNTAPTRSVFLVATESSSQASTGRSSAFVDQPKSYGQ